ncbi:hypothetical protein BLSTO_04872 [Blastocystis sp. subtype 1]
MDAVKLLTERQPIWDKRYLILEVMKICSAPFEVVKNSVAMVVPYVCYTMTDGPFRNVWIRLGYNPSLDPSSWKYQYIEFRFSKRPVLRDASKNAESLPSLYDIPLNLHNRYPLYILQTDSDMQQLISRIIPNSHFDRRFGWVQPQQLNDIRTLLKKQAVLLLDRQGFNTDSVLFTTTKKKIHNTGGNRESRGRKKKQNNPSFDGSTESLMKEMPLDLLEESLQERMGRGIAMMALPYSETVMTPSYERVCVKYYSSAFILLEIARNGNP